MCISGIAEEKRENRKEIFKLIMAENFPKIIKNSPKFRPNNHSGPPKLWTTHTNTYHLDIS